MLISCSHQFSDFYCRIQFEQLPKEVIDRAKYFFLDYLGIAIRAARIDSSQPVHALIKEINESGYSTVIGESKPTISYWAVLANGTAAHSLELDDTFLEGSIHNECFIYATALAKVEELKINGKRFIEAVVSGFDMACRVSKALQPAITNARGFHPTGICGVLGSVVTAGKLLQLDTLQMTSAIGVAASQASGLLEYLTDGTWTKRFHAGWAAHAGLVAAGLAKHGFSGPPTALEGKFGFLHAYSGNPKLKGMVEGLGKEYKILQTAIKFYPCVYYVQAAVDAMLEIVNNYELIPEQVELIKVDTLTAGFNIACHPIDKKRHPTTILDAQFSMYFNVAVALLKKRVTLAEYTPEMFHSPILQEIMNKIHCETDSTFDAMYPEAWPARVTILTKKGKTLVAEIKFPKGDPHNPLSWDELVIKHKSIVKGILSDAEDEKLIAFVRDLEKQIHFDVLSEILRNF